MKNVHHTVLIVCLVCASGGCERKALYGRVVDNFGRPVAGAELRIEGSGFATRTDARGNFELAYAPGTLRLEVAADAHLSERRTITIATQVRYPLGDVRLLRMPPPGNDVAVQGPTQYQVIAPQTLARTERVDSRDQVLGTAYGCRFFDVPSDAPALSGTRFVSLMPARSYTTAIFRARDGHVVGSILGGIFGPRRDCPSAERLPGDPTIVGAFELFSTDLTPGSYCVAGIEGLTGGPNLSLPFYCFRWRASEGR